VFYFFIYLWQNLIKNKITMAYIDQTLTSGEKIISSSIFHWWFTARIFVYCLLIVLMGVATLNVESLKELGDLFGYTIIAFAPVLALIQYIFALIAKKTTEQILTNKRVFLKTGLIRRNTDELIREKVETISINQTVVGRIMGFGDVEFTGTGGIKIKFQFVKDPTSVKKAYEQ
jgi:uncharacterized membrane protein YdbT with pleckstrin-like domain